MCVWCWLWRHSSRSENMRVMGDFDAAPAERYASIMLQSIDCNRLQHDGGISLDNVTSLLSRLIFVRAGKQLKE